MEVAFYPNRTNKQILRTEDYISLGKISKTRTDQVNSNKKHDEISLAV